MIIISIKVCVEARESSINITQFYSVYNNEMYNISKKRRER